MAVQAQIFGTRSKLAYAADISPVSPSGERVLFKNLRSKINGVTTEGLETQFPEFELIVVHKRK